MGNQLYPGAVRGLGYTVIKAPEDQVIVQSSPSWASTRVVQSLNPVWHWRLLYDVLIDNPLKPNPSYAYTDLQTLLGFVIARRNDYDDFLFLDPDDNFFGPAMITQSWLPNYPFAFGAIIVVGAVAWQVTAAPAGARSGLSQPSFASSPQTDGALTWTQLGSTIGGGWPNPFAQLSAYPWTVSGTTTYYSPLQILRGGQFYQDVFDLASALNVYENGVLSSNYQLQIGGMAIPNISSSGLYLQWNSGYTPNQPITASFNYYYRAHFEDDSEDFEKFAYQLWTEGGSEGMKGKGELKFVSARLASSSTSGVPANIPMPGIGNCPSAKNFITIYPTQAVISFGSGPGQVTGYAAGMADGTANSWFEADIHFQGLGSSGGQVSFSGFILPPWLPPAMIKCVYIVTAYNHILGNGVAGCKGTFDITGYVVNSQLFQQNGFGQFVSVAQIDRAQSSVFPLAANFPVSGVTLHYFEGELDFVTSTDKFVGKPAMLVYY